MIAQTLGIRVGTQVSPGGLSWGHGGRAEEGSEARGLLKKKSGGTRFLLLKDKKSPLTAGLVALGG